MPPAAPLRVDLRSDTVTRPSAAMRQAMATAEVGDDVFGEDPSVNRLEARAAALLGKEAALFVASGTMANQLAVRGHAAPGEEILCHRDSHVIHYEGGAAAGLSGVNLWPLAGAGGQIEPAAVAEALATAGPYSPRPALVWLENTHNRCGGRVISVAATEAVAAVARAAGVPLHLDGARLFNASVAAGVPPARLAAPAATVSICLSKGLGAPVGSLIAGPADWIARARRQRRMFGGGWRQAGILAAAGLHALDHHVDRLADDHRRARRLAVGLAGLPGLVVDPAAVETNIVLADLAPAGPDAAAWVAAAAARGLGIVAFGPRRLRLTTHLDVDDEGIDWALAVMAGIAGS